MIPRDYYLDDLFSNYFNIKDSNEFKCDVYEKNDKCYIEIDVPNVKKEDILIEYNNEYLNINIKKNNYNDDEDKNYIRRERIYKEQSRSFYIGKVDEKDINAKFNNGNLIIEIPKTNENNTKKIIEIEGN